MIDLSRMSPVELRARVVALEVEGGRLRAAATAALEGAGHARRVYAEHRREIESENAALRSTLSGTTAWARDAEYRCSMATVNAAPPVRALACLLDAVGWIDEAPGAEMAAAHANAHPIEPAYLGPSRGMWAAEEGEVTDPNAPTVGGLWAYDCPNGVGLVELFRGRHGDPWVQYVGAGHVNADCELFDLADEGITGWLRLTAEGRPVGR